MNTETPEAMIASLEKSPPVRVPGTAVYMSRALNVIPFALMHNLKHNKVLHERVILLTLRTEDAPYVHNVRRVQIEQLSPTFWRVVASYGWRETPNVEEVFHRCGLEGLSCRMMETSFFMSHESLIIGKRPWYLRLRGKLYLILQRNALRAPDQFEIPPNRVIELGTRRDLSFLKCRVALRLPGLLILNIPAKIYVSFHLAKRFDTDHNSVTSWWFSEHS